MAGELYMETGKTPLGIQLLSDLGDHQTFGLPGVDLWSALALTDVRPNGVIAGVNMGSPAASGANDACDVAAIVCMIMGVKTPVAADTDVTITRPATDVAKINSFTVTSAGEIAVVAGLDGLSSAYSLVRGAAGGPPLIPVDSTELFLVKVTDSDPAPITAGQIVHTTEFAEVFTIHETGFGDHSEFSLRRRAHIFMGRELPLIHTGPATRRIYADIAEPQKTLISKTKDFKAAEVSSSITSTQFYDALDAEDSDSLAAGGFSAKLVNGVSDLILASRKKVRTFWFYPDKDQTDHVLTQGKVSAARTWEVGGGTMAAVVIAAKQASVEIFID